LLSARLAQNLRPQRCGSRGAIFAPTIVADVAPDMQIFPEEFFGSAVAVTAVESMEEAIALGCG